MRSKRSQSIFDFAVAIIAIAGLVVGIVRIWVWFNANYAKRQLAYQKSRIIAAGRVHPNYNDEQAPVDIGRTIENPLETYHPLQLSEDWVFKGRATGTVSGGGPSDAIPTNPKDECHNTCFAACPECGTTEENFDVKCECYQNCSVKCYCNSQIQPAASVYDEQVKTICGPDMDCRPNPEGCNFGQCNTGDCGIACSLRKNAKDMDDKADELDNPWSLVYYFGGHRSARELRKAAKDMRRNALKQENSAEKMKDNSQDLKDCCNNNATEESQRECLEVIKLRADCDKECQELSSNFYDKCQKHCPAGPLGESCENYCQLQADAQYNACAPGCTGGELSTCEGRIAGILSALSAQKEQLAAERADLVSLTNGINNELPVYNAAASFLCSANCTQLCGNTTSACYHNCYNPCYEAERNLRCQGFVWNSTWLPEWKVMGRNCDLPASNCDFEYTCPSGKDCVPPGCGLSKVSSDSQKYIIELDKEIASVDQVIASLPGCCNLEKPEDQDDCIANKLSE